MARRCHLYLVLASVVVLSACESAASDFETVGGKADSPFAMVDLVPGTAPHVGLLRFVNDTTTTEEVLDSDAALRSDAARNIIEHRDGGGLLSDPFDSVDELDSVPRIGESAILSMLSYAVRSGFVPQGDELLGVYDSVSFSVNEAGAALSLVNRASLAELDDTYSLDVRAARAIIEERPLQSVLQLSELSFVGESALLSIKAHSEMPASPREVGILSDLDKTIIPPSGSFHDFPEAPYPGMAELLNILEFGDGSGAAGDVNFVTARQPDMVTSVPAWFEEQGIPLGPIHTGISGVPFIAKDEKVRDITSVFEANPEQTFVMFGDSSHVDPDAYRIIQERFDAQVEVAFIHNVKVIDPARLEGLILIENYAEAACELMRIGRLTEDEARMVVAAVVAGGELDEQEAETLIIANRL